MAAATREGKSFPREIEPRPSSKTAGKSLITECHVQPFELVLSAFALELMRKHQPDFDRVREFTRSPKAFLKYMDLAGLIALGVKRRATLTKHMGAGVAYKVACEAMCPVLSVGARFRG